MDIKTVDEEIKDKSIDELKELVKQQQGSIDALKALMGQLIIIVESIQPLLKERPEIDQGTVEMVDRLLMLSKMIMAMGEQANGNGTNESDGDGRGTDDTGNTTGETEPTANI